MIRITCAAAAALVGLGSLVPGTVAAQATDDGKWTQAATSFVNKMAAGDFLGAASMAGPATVSYFTADKLEPIWKQVSAGEAVKSVAGKSVIVSGAYHVVDLDVAFAAHASTLRVALDDNLKVNGFFMTGAGAAPAYATPAYADPAKFEEIPMQLSAGDVKLPAILTVPRGVAHPPVLVLVHGSGPNDMNETIGPNQPFKDLAWGLATRGIAVLRYDKRTKVAPFASAGITVEKEVILDALTALDSARTNARVDGKRVYLLGHSLGAMLAPEIAVRDNKLSGVLLFASTPRELGVVIGDQYAYLKTLPANAAPDVQKSMADAQAQIARLNSKEAKPTDLVIGAPAAYFYDLNARNAVPFAKKLKVPMLFMQGGRDYQVLPEDFAMWRKDMAGHTNATFKLYPDLNHLFMTGTGKATPAEYGTAGHMKVDVIEDAARFINGR